MSGVLVRQEVIAVPPSQVYEALLEDLKDGNCPGSELHIGEANEQTVWVHTADNVSAWLGACQRDGVGNEPTAYQPAAVSAAEVLRDAAAEQRRLAEDARTDVGRAEHEDIADWPEERADQVAEGLVTCDEQRLGTCSPEPAAANHTNCTCDLCAACPCSWAQITVGHLCDLRTPTQVLLDREELSLRLHTAAGHRWDHRQTVDAVLGLVRPMPMRDQLVEFFKTHRGRILPSGPACTCGWIERPYGSALWEPNEYERHLSDAVLALLKGGQS